MQIYELNFIHFSTVSRFCFVFVKGVKDLSRTCVFVYHINSPNLYSFSIGSNSSVYLTFDKFGDIVNARWSSLLALEEEKISLKRAAFLSNKTTPSPPLPPVSCHLLYVHTKLSDAVILNSVNSPLRFSASISRSRSASDKIAKTRNGKHIARHQHHARQSKRLKARKMQRRRHRPFRRFRKLAHDKSTNWRISFFSLSLSLFQTTNQAKTSTNFSFS